MIRPATPADAAAIDDICVRTGAAGGDARGRFSSDDLLPDVWARPYLALEPELCFVVDLGRGARGYLVATADTASFVEAYRRHWLPGFAERWSGDRGPADAEHVAAGLDPDRMIIPELDRYPAHLHIDLVPEAQHRGWGRALIETVVAELARRAVPGVHVGVDPANAQALAFYDRLGFAALPSGALGLSIH